MGIGDLVKIATHLVDEEHVAAAGAARAKYFDDARTASATVIGRPRSSDVPRRGRSIGESCFPGPCQPLSNQAAKCSRIPGDGPECEISSPVGQEATAISHEPRFAPLGSCICAST